MNNGVLVNWQAFNFADYVIFAALGQGLMNEVKIPLQELGGQRGEGAYFQENLVICIACMVCTVFIRIEAAPQIVATLE